MTAEPSRPTHPFVTTAPARATLPRLVQDFGARAPFVLLTGDPGSGRSWLAGEWIDRMGGRSAPVVLPDPAPLANDVTDVLCALFGGSTRHTDSPSERTARLVEAVRLACAEQRVGLVIADDADRLDDAQLLELERIARGIRSADVPFEVLLVGSPLLPLRLASPALADVRAQVSLQVTLARLTPEDTREYLLTRLGSDHTQGEARFSRKACRDIHQEALGLIGTVEAIAAEALRRAGTGPVSTEHVRQAVRVVRTGRGTEHAPYEPSSHEPEGAPATPVATVAPTPVATNTTNASDDVRVVAANARTVTNASATPPPHSVPANTSSTHEPTRPTGSAPRDARHAEPDWTPPELDTRPHNERAKDWLERFGGAGSIRIGVPSAPAASLDEAELLARVNAEDAAAFGHAEDAAAFGRSKDAAAFGHAEDAAAFDRSKDASASAHDETPHTTSRRAAPRPAPSAPAARGARPAFAGPVVAIAAVALLVAIGWTQRDVVRSAFPSRSAEANRTAPAPSVPEPPTVIVPAPVTPTPPPLTEFTIVVGRFGTRDMARAERDHLARLLSHEMRVVGARDGRAELRLGRFATQELADYALAGLQNRGLLSNAEVLEVERPASTADSTLAGGTNAATATATPGATPATGTDGSRH
ncbi:MAG: hypothetical protein RL721_2332 [Candidatus Eisenbacteria bacterium]|jgi:type II secretory pathway predicted ATPase ExeA